MCKTSKRGTPPRKSAFWVNWFENACIIIRLPRKTRDSTEVTVTDIIHLLLITFLFVLLSVLPKRPKYPDYLLFQ